jgi:hypothetical protein
MNTVRTIAAVKSRPISKFQTRRTLMTRSAWVLVVLLLVLLVAAQVYTVTDLGTLGGTINQANALNATGQCVRGH